MEMKLWLLEAKEGTWENSWDVLLTAVVQAPTEHMARRQASLNAGDEARQYPNNPWLQEEFVSCIELVPGNTVKTISIDFKAG